MKELFITVHSKRYLITHPWVAPRQWLRGIKYSWQRASRGYSDLDAWNLNSYLAGWIPEVIEKHMVNGYPASITEEKWGQIKKGIIEGFEAYLELEDLVGFPLKEEYDSEEEYDKALEIWKLKEENLGAKQRKGLELFVKWFDALWD